MALIWADNFKQYGVTESNMLAGIYADVWNSDLVEDPDPNVTGNVILHNSGGSGAWIRYALPGGAITTGGFSTRIWYGQLPDVSSGIEGAFASFRDGANTAQVSLIVTTTGVIQAWRGRTDTGTLLGATSVPVITAQAWHHIEAKVLISETVGTVEVRVNGVVKLNLTGLDTANTANINYAQLRFGDEEIVNDITFGNEFHQKDLVVWDTTGSSNNDFFGTVSVFTLEPDGDVALPWTPSTGTTGFDLIDETTPSDADYISAADPPPALSEFTLSNLPADITSVRGLIPVVRAAKTDGGDGSIQVGLKGTLTDLGADRPITSAFTYWYDVSELSPDTGVAWTPVEVDAAKMTIDRTV